jgi:hypothetical protein
MSRPKPPDPVKLVIGVLVKDRECLEIVVPRLMETQGEIDTVSPWLPFHYTSYYREEMGEPLFRRMISFRRLISQDDLSGIKLRTNDLEAEMSENGRRKINIDPGYLARERFVLATGKNFSHRIHIGGGIYADLTLLYREGAFQVLPWTYPDYAQPDIRDYLFMVRRRYVFDLKKDRKI